MTNENQDQSAAAVEFTNASKRTATVELNWPVMFAGMEYDTIVLKRLTVSEVASFIEKMTAEKDSAGRQRIRFPIFYTPDGAAVPEAVLDGLDDDDALRLDEAAANFLPRRFAALQGDADPPTGGPAEQSSTE